MNVRYFYVLKYIVGLTLLAGSWTANANLLDNGTFDTDLSGWTTILGTPGTGVTWDSGEARVGQPGTPGTALFFQPFDIAAGTTSLAIVFDYEWQLNRPSSEDTFTATFEYESNSGTQSFSLVNQGSNLASFNSVIMFSALQNIVDLKDEVGNGKISFFLAETNSSNGTRVHIDNVGVSAVPVPAAVWLFGTALIGLVGFGKRRKAA